MKKNNFTIAIWALGVVGSIAVIVILWYLLRPKDKAGAEMLPSVADTAMVVSDRPEIEVIEPVEAEAEDTATVIDPEAQLEKEREAEDVRLTAEIHTLGDQCRQLMTRMGRMRNSGQLDADNYSRMKNELLALKDRQISLAQQLSDGEEILTQCRQEKEELQAAFSQMESN